MDDNKRIALAVSWKLSNLLVQDSVSLLGFEDQLEIIETKLRETVHSLPMIHRGRSLRQIVYEIEDVIDFLVMKQSQKIGSSGNPMHCLLPLIELIDGYKLRKKLDEITVNLFNSGKIHYYRESWWKVPKEDLDVGETIISPVIKKVNVIVSEGDLNPQVKRKARWLRDELISLHIFLKILQVNELSENAEAWMEEVYDVLRLAEDSIGSFLFEKEKMRQTWSLAFPIQIHFSRRKLSKEMDMLKTKLQDITRRRLSTIKRRPQRIPQLSIRRQHLHSSSANAEKPDIIAIFDGDIDDIVEMLLRDDPTCLTVSIVGMEGAGKTSLAKLIYENQTITDHFEYRVWVASAHFDSLMTQFTGEEYSRMANSGTNNYNDFLCNSRLMLNASLKSNKYFIVIDGVSAKTLWNELGAAFDDISNGTRVIFTAREAEFTPPVSENNFTYRLQLRSDDESWALFSHILRRSIPADLLQLKKEILRRCGGLPLMIREFAGLLIERDARFEEWSGLIEQLNQDEGPWSRTLEEINENLALYLRRCLFYFGLFPQDYDIPARRLIALWVAEGLGRQKGDGESPESVSEKCLMELVNRNMVQATKRKLNGKISKCRIPDALRFHWLTKAKEANFLQDNMGVIGGIRRLADHLDNKDPSFDHIHGKNTSSAMLTCYKNAVSFLSFDTQEGSRPGEDIGSFLDRCISNGCFSFLWVLDLEQVYKPKLPRAVGQLIRLRYLGLRSTYLEILPAFIDKLLNLQTLDLKRTCIENVPSTIWKMQRLRYLFLDESFRTVFVPRQEDSSLVDLQTLWGAFVDEYSPVRNGLDTLCNLTKLGLRCKISVSSQKQAVSSQKQAMSSQLIAVADWVMNLKRLQFLRLKSFDESNQLWDLHLDSLSDHTDLSSVYLAGKLKNPKMVSKFPQNLIELTLSASGLVNDPMQELDKLPNLRILKLFSKSFTGSRMICSNGGFPTLEVLKLWGLEVMEEWIVEEEAVPRLKDLEIRSCRNLKMLPDGLQQVRSLRKLRLAKSPQLSSGIKKNQGEEWNKISHVQHVCIED